MFLKDNEIKNITAGAVKIEKNDTGLRFYKCTDKQIKAWYDFGHDLGVRAESTTGIRLDFITNASKACFEVCGGKFEILINGLLSKQEIIGDDFTGVQVELNCKENRVTFLFPSHSIGMLKSVYINDGAEFRPTQFKNKFLFLGDSITQGWNMEF